MNDMTLVVFDLETSGLNEHRDRVVQFGAKAYNYRTLKPIPVEAGGEFVSYSRPDNVGELDFTNKAFEINGVRREDLENAPDEKAVFLKFVSWINGFNPGKSVRMAPYAGGKNIIGFDLKWIQVLLDKHCTKKTLFNSRRIFDLEDDIERWFGTSHDLPNQKMDTLRAYFGLPESPTHDALKDSREEGALLVHFLQLYRTMKTRVRKDGTPLISFRGAMQGVPCV